MTFLRIDKKSKESYLRICRNERQGSKVVQKTLYSLGGLSQYSDGSLQSIGKQLYVLGGGTLDNLESSSCREIARFNYGFPLIISNLCKLFDLDVFFARIQRRYPTQYTISSVVHLLLCNRWNDPMSKLGIFKIQDDYIGIKKVKLQQIYRTLDRLSGVATALQEHLYRYNRKLLSYKVDVVFYDVTTFYFESEVEEVGQLRQKGFGKDGKIGNTQVLLGLILDKNRQPLGYELYSGDTYEGHTFRDAVARLKTRFQIEKVVIVADSGMLNADNLQLIEDSKYSYILGESVKKLPKAIIAELLDKSAYEHLQMPAADATAAPINIPYRITTYKGRKILCTYSEKRAKKDRLEREKKIQKALTLQQNSQLLRKKAAIYYLKGTLVNTETGEVADPEVDKNTKWFYQLDQKKITEAAKFDGLKAISTNDNSLTNQELLSQYKQLYQIEQSFRTFKTFLETRPMFHWTDKRIKGHFAICYLSFCLLNHLQNLLKKHGITYSENDIRRTLSRMQLTELQQNEQTFYLRSALDEKAMIILKTLKIKTIPNICNNTNKIKYNL